MYLRCARCSFLTCLWLKDYLPLNIKMFCKIRGNFVWQTPTVLLLLYSNPVDTLIMYWELVAVLNHLGPMINPFPNKPVFLRVCS